MKNLLASYLYKLDIVRSNGAVDTIKSDNLSFLIELGDDGLKYGRYLSATISPN